MATVRQDNVQLRIDFITDESRKLAATILETQKYNRTLAEGQKELEKYRKELADAGKDEAKRVVALEKIAVAEKKVAGAAAEIVAAGKKVEALDLSKVTPAQLIERAKQLAVAMSRIPQSAPEFKSLEQELAAVNGRLGELRQNAKGISSGGSGGLLQTILGVAGGLSLPGILSSLGGIIGKLFETGSAMDALKNKADTVFGESAAIVRAFAEGNAHDLGLTRNEFVETATSVGDLLVPMGFTKEAAANLSNELVKQGGILAQWKGGKVSAQEATEILNKALLGERDALNSLGVDIKQSLVDEELKKRGLQNLTGESKRQAEALITLQQITKQSTSANEAFASGIDNAAKKKARLRAEAGELSDRLAKALIPVFNFLVDVGIQVGKGISSVIEWFNRTPAAAKVVEIAFQTLLYPVGFFKKAVEEVWQRIKAFAGAAGELFDAAKSVASGDFSAIKGLGKRVGDAYNEGWNTARVFGAEESKAQAAATGEADAKSQSDAYEKMLADLAKNGERDKDKAAKEAAKRQKERLDNELKGVEAAALRAEVVAENARLKSELSEREFGNRLVEIKRQRLQAELDVYKRFKQEESVAALKTQNELLDLEASIRRPAVAPLAALDGKGITPVKSQTKTALDSVGVSGVPDRDALEVKFKNALDVEFQYLLEKERIQSEFLQRQLDALTNAGLKETKEYERIAKEKDKVDDERKKNQEKLTKFQGEVERARYELAKEAIHAGIELLGLDANARKKFASTIKAFQIGEIITQGILEVQKIHAKYASVPFGEAIAIPETIRTIIRTGVAVAKVAATKFARGGYTGRGFGAPDESGFRPAGVVHEGEHVNPKWQVEHPTYGPVIRWLEHGRQRGYASGGDVLLNTTPVNLPPLNLPGQQIDLAGFASAISDFKSIVRAFPRHVQASVSLTDFEARKAEKDFVESEASI